MALSNLQQRIERSFFEALRTVLVGEGYLPDITDTGTFGQEPYTKQNQDDWNTALQNKVGAKGFAVEAYNHSLEQGIRRVPRIAIIPRRTMPGELGNPSQPYYQSLPADPQNLAGVSLPLETSHMYFDIHMIAASTDQGRVLNAVVGKALGAKKFIKYYDDLKKSFFIRQYNYYDIPDTQEGQEEKIYAYEVPDLYDVQDDLIPQAKIETIKMGLKSFVGDSILAADGTVIGQYVEDGTLEIFLNGSFNTDLVI